MDSTVRVIFLGDAASAIRSVSTLEGRMGSLGNVANRTGKLLAGAIGVSLVGGLAKATSLAIGFDRSMRNVNSIAGLSEKQLQRLSKQVLALGKTTGQGPKVLADGLYDVVSSGFKANDALKILRTSAIAATAGMTDTATASKGVVAVLNAYHLSADKARNVSSLLFKEVQLGVNTFGELAQNLGDTVPLAAQLKIPFSDVAAGLALITTNGTSMAEASTQMSRVMADILKPSKGLSKTLHDMGYETGQAAIQAHGFVPLINQLSQAAHGNADATSGWFGNIRSLRGMLNLTGPNLQKFNSFARQMAKSFRDGGDDLKAFNEQSKSISVQWQKAVASLNASAIKLGTQMFPALIKGIGYLSDFAGWLGKLSGEHSIKAKVEFAGQTAEDFASHVKDLVSKALTGGAGGVQGQRLQQPGMPVDLKFQRGFVQTAQAKILGMGGWDAIGAKIGAAIGNSIKVGAGTLDNFSKGLVSWANGPGGNQAAEAGLTIGLKMIETLLDPSFWISHWQLIGAIVINAILVAFPEGRLLGIGEKVLAKPLVKAMLELSPKLKGAAEAALVAVASVVERAGASIPGIALRLVDAVLRVFSKGFGRFAGIVKVLLWDVLLTELGQLASQAYSAASHIADRIIAGIKTAPGKLVGLAGDLGKYLLAALNQAASDGYTWALTVGEQIAQGVLDGLKGLPGKIAGVIGLGGGHGNKNTSTGNTGRFQVPHPSTPGKAAGDKIDKPMLSWIGEDAPTWPEWVIPSNPVYRGRALGLLSQATSALGLPGFAAGGGPSRGGHATAPGKKLRGRTPIKAAVGAAQSAVNALTAAQQRVSDLGRTYDQDARAQGAVTLPPLTVDVPDDPSDPTSGTHQVVNPAGIAAATAQLNQLVTEKNGILGALEQERQRIEDAISSVQKAIDDLLDAIKVLNDKAKVEGARARSEHQQATAASNRVSAKGGLQDQVAAERAAKKPNKAKISQLEAAIKQAGRDHDAHEGNAKDAETKQGRYQKQAGDDASKVKDLRGTLGGLLSNRHDLPFDVRDQQIDVAYLQQQIAQVQGTTGTAPGAPSAGGGGSTITPGGAASSDDSMLQAMIAQLTQALGLQFAQESVIQGLPSFARGIAYVPNDMVAQLHAGESVRTADQTAAAFRNQTAGGPITVHLSGVVALEDQVEAWVEQNGQKIAAQVVGPLGRAADTLRRSGRTT